MNAALRQLNLRHNRRRRALGHVWSYRFIRFTVSAAEAGDRTSWVCDANSSTGVRFWSLED